MKKIFRIVSAVLLLVFVFTGCSTNKSSDGAEKDIALTDGDSDEKDITLADGIYLDKLEVYSNAVNSKQIYHITYPYHYFTFTTDRDGNVESSLFDLRDPIPPEELAEQENGPKYFVEYCNSLPEKEKGEDLACYVICTYIDEEGNVDFIHRKCYDNFPEGWEEFIDRCNEICGGEYLTGQGQLQTVTPEFLTEIFGITDEDIREGTLQDMIDLTGLDMERVTDLYTVKYASDVYYAELKEPLIEPHRPRELVSADSTQEEYEAFLTQFFEKIGADNVIEKESDQRNFRRFYLVDEDDWFYTARSSEMEKLPAKKDSTDTYYYMELDAHECEMTMKADFIYSADKKYILVPMVEHTDMVISFCE